MKRIVFLDYVRVFACFLVMLVHSSENFYIADGMEGTEGPVTYILSETDRLWVSIYDGFSRMAVPLFMIVSAFLLMPLKEGQTTWQFYRRRFLRVVPPFVIFMVLYSILPMLWGQIDGESSIHDLLRIPLNFPSMAGHLWFMYPLISLYLIIPFISPWLSKSTEKEERFFLILFLLSTCMPYLNHWFGDVWGQCSWNTYHLLWYFSGYLGYSVLAHYIRVRITWSVPKRMIVGASLLMVGALVTILSFYVQAVPGQVHPTPEVEIGWAYCTINCALMTAGTFLMFSCIRLPETPRLVEDLSKQSYGMYLMHIFWLGVWTMLFKADLGLSSVIAIPAIAISTFISSYITTKLISFIPGSKWIIG